MKYYSLNEVQTKIKDKNKCRALRAVPFHPFSCCLIFYLSLCVFPDVLNRSGEDCLMRKQTFASARLFRDSRSWKWNWSDLKRVEKAIRKTCITLHLQYWETVFKVFEICLGETRATDPIIQQNFTQFVTSPSASAKQITPFKQQITTFSSP